MNKIVINYDQKRLEAVSEIANLVAVTAGPYGQNVEFIGGNAPMMFRDGYRVLDKFLPQDDLTLGVKYRMQEAAYRTVRTAGDGSTTTTILLRWIYENAISWIASQQNDAGLPVSRRDIANGIRYAAGWCLERLKEADKIDISTDEGKRLLKMVATLAGSNNEKIGDAIANLIIAVGRDGYVMTEYDQRATDLSYEIKSGYRMPFGLIHPSMLPKGRREVTIQNAFVAMSKDIITNIDNLRPIISAWREYCNREEKIFPLAVIAPGIDADAQATMINRTIAKDRPEYSAPMWGMLPEGRLPWFGVKVIADASVWEDLEAITGAKAFSSRENRSIKYFKPESAIVMPSVVLSMEESVLHINDEALADSGLVSRLREMATAADEPTQIESRIARLEGRVGVVRIPVHSQAMRYWASEVFEDAYLASISAIEKGIVPGAGKALCSLSAELTEKYEGGNSASFDAGVYAVIDALPFVVRHLLNNGGVPEQRVDQIAEGWFLTGGWGTIKMNDVQLSNLCGNVPIPAIMEDGRVSGVIDSAAAIAAAIQSAAEEAADWVETSQCVVPGSYKQ